MPPSVTLEYKDMGSAPATVEAHQVDSEGIVDAYVAVTGIRDDVGDIIEPGFFEESLREIHPKMCLGHDWNRPIGEPVEIEELYPGDPRLPKQTHDGKPWPAEAGALWTRSRYMLDTEDGRNAYKAAKFYGPKTAYSIGYVPDKATTRFGLDSKGRQTRFLKKGSLYEYGPVLHGANNLARQAAIKSGKPAEFEGKIRLVRSMEYWGLPVGTPIRPGMKPRGPVARKREREGKPVDENLGAVEIDPNNPHSTRVKPTAKGKNKRNDGTFESDILTLFADGNTDPDSEEFVTSDPTNAPDRQRINKGNEYNPLDMLIANGVTPADLEDDLRSAEWTRGRSIGEVEDANASPEVQAFIDDVMDVYREKYNAALVQQNAAGQRDDIAEADDGSNVDLTTEPAPSGARRSTTSLTMMGPAEVEAAAREMDDAELAAHDEELTARAGALGKPGQRNRAHEAIAAERERRKGQPPEQAAPAGTEVPPPADEPVTVVEADPAPGFAIPPPPVATAPDGRPLSELSDMELETELTESRRRVQDARKRNSKPGVRPNRRAEEQATARMNAAEAEVNRRQDAGMAGGTENAPEIDNPDVSAGDAPSPVDGARDTGADTPGDIPAEDDQAVPEREAPPIEDDGAVVEAPGATVEDQDQFEPGAVLGDDGKPVPNVPVNDAGDYYDPHGDIVSGQTQFDQVLNQADDAIGDGDPGALAAALNGLVGYIDPDGDGSFTPALKAQDLLNMPAPEAISTVRGWVDEANAGLAEQEGVDREATTNAMQGADDDYLAGEAARIRGILIEESASGTPATDGFVREASMRLRTILAEQERRTGKQDTTEAPTLPTPDDVATLTAEDLAEANSVADASHGIVEADDGEFEAEPDIADRQDRIAGLLTSAQDGAIDFSEYSDDGLRSTRADVVSELRLQDYLTTRRSQERATAKRERDNATATPGEITEPDGQQDEPEGPKPRPGVAGAAEDLADALDEGDEERIRTTRARLESSLRRSRSDSEHVATLRGMLESGQDVTPEQLRATAEAIRIEARTRRNEQARERRKVRRFERDRLRNLLHDVENAMSGRGLSFDAVPEASEDLETPNLGAPGAGSWSSRVDYVEWLGRNDVIREVSGQQYTASVISPASGGKSVYEWSVTGPGDTVIGGRGEAADADDAIRLVESVLETQRALGNLPIDAVLPQSMPARESSAQTLGEFVAAVDAIRDRLAVPDTPVNPLTGERDPIRSQAKLRPPVNQLFTSSEQVRQHLLAKLAAETDDRLKKGLDEAVTKVRWDDVQLTKGGALAVFTYAGRSSAEVMHTPSGQRISVPGVSGKADLLRIASIMEALPDRHGHVMPFDRDADELRSVANTEWESTDGAKGFRALTDAAKSELAAAKLREGKFTAPMVRDYVDGKFYWGNQTNPDRKAFVDMQIRTVGYLLTNSNADKATKNTVLGVRAYLKAGAPDLAIALLRRRAGELREQFGAKADDRGASALDDAATGLLSMWSPQSSPGTRARRMKAGERVSFAENDGVRTFRAINDMRAEGQYGGISSTLAIDESNGTIYRLHIGPAGGGVDGIAISPQFGGGYPIIKTELGGDKFIIIGDGEETPVEADQIRPRNLADAGSVPPEVIETAAVFLPETAGETADRRAAAPAGGRPPRRGSAGAPARRPIPQPEEVPPVKGEQHLALAQSRMRAGWLGSDKVELADTPDGGGFTSVEQWREWATGELARIRAEEPHRERNFAVIETPDYETVKLSPGGHFLVTKAGYVVHARTTGAVWGAGDGFRRVTANLGETTTQTSAMVADYLERVTVDGDRVNWQAADIGAEVARFTKAHKLPINIPAARMAYQDFATGNKGPLKKKELDTLAGLVQATPGEGLDIPSPETIHALDLTGMTTAYFSTGRGQARSSVVATTKAGTELAKKIEMEISTAADLHRVAPLDAVRRLNRLADSLGDTVIERVEREGGPAEPLRPADDLRKIAKGITDAFDETKITPAGLMRRSGDTGRITAGPKASIGAYMEAARPQDKSVAAELTGELKASPEIRVWRDDDGHLHASFLGREIAAMAKGDTPVDAAVLGTGPDGRFSATWTDRRTGARLRLELPPGSWEFEPETVADPAGGNLTEPDETGQILGDSGQPRTEPDGATSGNEGETVPPATPASGAQGDLNRAAAQVGRERDALKDLDVEQLQQRLADARQRAGTDASAQEEIRVLRREIDARESAQQDVAKAPGTGQPDTPAGPDAEVERKIQQVYTELARNPGSWVGLADLRDRLGVDVPRAEVDRVLKQMSRERRVTIAPESNRKVLDERDHAAALRIGGEEQHLLMFPSMPPK